MRGSKISENDEEILQRLMLSGNIYTHHCEGYCTNITTIKQRKQYYFRAHYQTESLRIYHYIWDY